MPDKPRHRSGYTSQGTEAVRSACLTVAVTLGAMLDDLCIFGGLVPALLIDLGGEGTDSEHEEHPGTNDLDLGLSLALLDDERYAEISDRLRREGFRADTNDAGNQTVQRWRWRMEQLTVTVDFLMPPAPGQAMDLRVQNLQPDFGTLVTPATTKLFGVSRWFTADLHLGHANIIEYSGRPFESADVMNRALIDGWNDVVAPDDEVWILGDFALGRIADTLPLVADLAGRKVLLTGNHDRCWPGHRRRAEGWEDRYVVAGFDEIVHGVVEIDVAGHRVLACHFPYRGDSHDLDRYVDSRPADRGQWLLHGHVHERWRQRGRMINVGVDAWDYRPASESQLAALIGAGPGDR